MAQKTFTRRNVHAEFMSRAAANSNSLTNALSSRKPANTVTCPRYAGSTIVKIFRKKGTVELAKRFSAEGGTLNTRLRKSSPPDRRRHFPRMSIARSQADLQSQRHVLFRPLPRTIRSK